MALAKSSSSLTSSSRWSNPNAGDDDDDEEEEEEEEEEDDDDEEEEEAKDEEGSREEGGSGTWPPASPSPGAPMTANSASIFRRAARAPSLPPSASARASCAAAPNAAPETAGKEDAADPGKGKDAPPPQRAVAAAVAAPTASGAAEVAPAPGAALELPPAATPLAEAAARLAAWSRSRAALAQTSRAMVKVTVVGVRPQRDMSSSTANAVSTDLRKGGNAMKGGGEGAGRRRGIQERESKGGCERGPRAQTAPPPSLPYCYLLLAAVRGAPGVDAGGQGVVVGPHAGRAARGAHGVEQRQGLRRLPQHTHRPHRRAERHCVGRQAQRHLRMSDVAVRA